MPSTYTLISSNVLSSNTATVTFSSIPQTYTDLVLRISARSATAFVMDSIKVVFNSDTSAVYSRRILYGTGSSAGSDNGSAENNSDYSLGANGNTATSSTFGSSEIYIPSYTVAQNKPTSSFGVAENNATAARVAVTANLWRNTAAITTIAISTISGSNWLTDSSFYLYGIKNS